MKKTKEQKILLALDLLRKMSDQKIDVTYGFAIGVAAIEDTAEEVNKYVEEAV